jgi:hypothetical protein
MKTAANIKVGDTVMMQYTRTRWYPVKIVAVSHTAKRIKLTVENGGTFAYAPTTQFEVVG